MEIKEPEFRCGTTLAIEELANELNLPCDKSMQDWSYEIANPEDVEKYLFHYDTLLDEDKKFVLMETIIQATEDQPNSNLFEKYWSETKKRLATDFRIHEYTIFYWSCFDNKNPEDCWDVTANMRVLWTDQKK